jgi:hypothetical protein
MIWPNAKFSDAAWKRLLKRLVGLYTMFGLLKPLMFPLVVLE